MSTVANARLLSAAFILLLVGSVDSVPGEASVRPPAPYGAVPSERQLKWHELEVYGMVNFSTITYYGKEWGFGDEEAARFNPTEFDARQIVRAAKTGGLRGLIIDAKHHGGFCLWPSKFTDYSVKNCPWKNGQGDMVRELVDACRVEGLQVSMYLSPWDRNHKDYAKPEYVAYFRNQLTELLTEYGPVFEVWWDGANGGDGYYGGAKETRTIDKRTYYNWPDIMRNIVHKLQPDACVFTEIGPEIRWVGNEGGYALDPCWATFTPRYRGSTREVEINPQTGYFYELPNGDSNYPEAEHGHRNGRLWIPAEADFPLRGGWFWHAGDQSKSPAFLVNRYFSTVGLNCAMDIGIAPDRRGLIDEPDTAALKGFGERIQAVFKTNLAQGARATASNVRGNANAYAACNVLNGKSKFKTYWATDDGVKDAELTLNFGQPTEFSVVSLREPIQLGQRIDAWTLDSWQDGQWQEFATGTGIGARRLWRGQPITTDKVRLRLINASASPAISEFGVYLEPEASRKESGTLVSGHIELGLSKTGWKVVSFSTEGEGSGLASYAIDGKPATFWHTHTAAGRQPPPQSLTVDMGKEQELAGLLYLPRQDNCAVGNVTRYAFAVSADGQSWTEVAQGEFGNIAANPVQQKVKFERVVKARYFRFTATGTLDGCANAAEIGVIGK